MHIRGAHRKNKSPMFLWWFIFVDVQMFTTPVFYPSCFYRDMDAR
jgi:hypothetical protein